MQSDSNLAVSQWPFVTGKIGKGAQESAHTAPTGEAGVNRQAVILKLAEPFANQRSATCQQPFQGMQSLAVRLIVKV